ncbi:MAG: hypothetical protein ACREYE_24380 [Gammaproteobacteria bacterium]
MERGRPCFLPDEEVLVNRAKWAEASIDQSGKPGPEHLKKICRAGHAFVTGTAPRASGVSISGFESSIAGLRTVGRLI